MTGLACPTASGMRSLGGAKRAVSNRSTLASLTHWYWIMNIKDFRAKLHELKVTTEMNQLYHQREAKRWWMWDKLVKIAVGFLAVLALVATFFPETWKATEISIAAVAAAV